jgi:hypothetical protein
MCLPIKVRHPEKVLSEGVHAGHEFITVHNGIGFRCGYVKVEKGHPWYGKGYDDIDCNVHVGLTFAEPDVPCDKGGPDDGYWIGFDTGHCNDATDPSLPVDSGRIRNLIPANDYCTIRTQEYVEAECRSLCEQAAAASQEQHNAK